MRRIWAFCLLLVMAAAPASAATFNFNLFRGGGDGWVSNLSHYDHNPSFVLAGTSGFYGQTAAETRYLALAPEPWSYSFGASGWQVAGNWTFMKGQSWWGAPTTSFGYVVNGVKTELSSLYGSVAEAGWFNFFVEAGDVFGWYVTGGAGYGGPGVAVVKAQAWESTAPAPIPLPTAGWMLLAGLGGLGVLRRRARAAA